MGATATYLSIVGIGKETTPGTAVPATATLRVTDFEPTIYTAYYADEGLHGSMAKTYGEVAGVTYSAYKLGGPVYADEIGWMIAGLLNDLSVTGAADPYTTTYSLLNTTASGGQPTSYTITDYNAVNSRAFAGMKVQNLDLTFTADGTLMYSANAVGISFATTSTPTQTYGGTAIIPNYECTATVGSSSAIVLSGDLSVSRTVTPVHAVDGTAAPNSIFAGSDLDVTGSVVLLYDSNAETALQTNFIGGASFTMTLDWVQSATREVKAVMTQCFITEPPTLTRQQGSWVELAVKYTAVANTTDIGTGGYSPIKFTTKNASASGTYK